ncbi:MAG TPA: hypothetical protein EYQ80_06185, partial [Candidatus Poseidoniales archaeon]|nr:hypothetical protein [Candidatus Poseidoniales archaeon]
QPQYQQQQQQQPQYQQQPTYTAQPAYGAVVMQGHSPRRGPLIAPWFGVGLMFLCMFMPFVDFSHEELNNKEADEVCEGILSLGADEDDLPDCPMNGFSTMGYVGDAIENSDDDDDDSSGGSSDDEVESEVAMFGIAFIMLFLSPIVFLLSIIISGLVLVFNKSPILVGVLQLCFFGAFMFISLMGIIDITDDATMSVHTNWAGWGFYVAGLSGILLCIKV